MSHPLDVLRHHVTGAIERGEGTAIVERPARVGTFEIAAHAGGFDVYDRDSFNYWEAPKGLVTYDEAATWAEWAHAFKTGRTFSSLAEWRGRHAERA
jgi:hypothetical protein